MQPDISAEPRGVPSIGAMVELLKPITWFPPMWAFMCGAVSAGVSLAEQPWLLPPGVLLVGPLVCGGSQIVNDWFDRHVDAINEPDRPIPSGACRVAGGSTTPSPGRCWPWPGVLLLGPWVLAATPRPVPRLGLQRPAAAFQAKRLVWQPRRRPELRGAGLGLRRRGAARRRPAAAAGAAAGALYSLGAHGIMTLNDFKSIEGDREIGIRSLPAQSAPIAPQKPRLRGDGRGAGGGHRAAAVLGQAPACGGRRPVPGTAGLLAMRRMLGDPLGLAPWYNGTGVTLYVLGMMLSAFAVRGGVVVA
jgi:chlorophyll synthase